MGFFGKQLPPIPPEDDSGDDQEKRSLDWVPIATGRTSTRTTLKDVSVDKTTRELMAAGDGAVIPVGYGKNKTGIKIFFADVDLDGTLHIAGCFSEGEIEAVDYVYCDNVDASTISGVTVATYTGTAGQAYPAALNAAFPAYTDNLPYVAYVYVRITVASELTTIPNITVEYRGIKCYDPDTSTYLYTTTPALCLANWLTNDRYGRGISTSLLDWTSVDTARDSNDALVSGSPRRTLNLPLLESRSIEQWISVLQEYAGVFLCWDDGELKMVLDRPAASEFTIDENELVIDSWQITEPPDSQMPGVVEVYWVDPDQDWRSIPEVVNDGTGNILTSRYYMDGINNASEAARYGNEKLNPSILALRDFDGKTFDVGLEILPGTRFTLNHSERNTGDIELRAISVNHTGNGQWQVNAKEYSASVYSDATASPPSLGDVTSSNPNSPPVPTGFSLSEELYLDESDHYKSRVRVEWDDMAASYPYFRYYEIKYESSTKTFPWKPCIDNYYTFWDVEIGETYTVAVRTISTSYAQSASEGDTINPAGDTTAPATPLGLTATAGLGQVALTWAKNTEADLDVYELWRRNGTDTWSDITLWLNFDHDSWLDMALSTDAYPYDYSVGDDTPILTGGFTIEAGGPYSPRRAKVVASTVNHLTFSISGGDLVDADGEGRFSVWFDYGSVWTADTWMLEAYLDDNNRWIIKYDSTTGEIRWYWIEGGVNKSFSTTTLGISSETWVILEGSWDCANNTRKIYKNGVLNITDSTTIAGFAADTLRIGNGNTGGSLYYMDSVIFSNDKDRDLYETRRIFTALPATAGFNKIWEGKANQHIDSNISNYTDTLYYRLRARDYAGNISNFTADA